jgi:DNA-binding transcriptional ArsR family regulator
MPLPYYRDESGVDLADPKEYDELFAALKHPVRRQILLFLDRKSEASFTDIQQEVGIDDTGLMSYHLKELAPLVEQSSRGKYCLSEVGQAGVVLFRKVEREHQRSSVAVRAEIDKFLGETIKKSLFFIGIAGLTLVVPMSFDISLSVQSLIGKDFSSLVLAGIFLLSLGVMILGAALFTVYDKHYFSKDAKTNMLHSTIYVAAVGLLSSLAFYSLYSFSQNTGVNELKNSGNLTLPYGALRAIIFVGSALTIANAFNKRHNPEKHKKPRSCKEYAY